MRMKQTLEQFASSCHDILKNNSGPSGRQKITEILKDVLTDQEFIAQYLPPTTGERDVIYEDPELGFCILAHRYLGAKSSDPHDHAHSWAIYGQVQGITEMRDFEKITEASLDQPGKVRVLRSYTLMPGMAHLYNEGDLHAPERKDSTSLIRIEGTDMSKLKRMKYVIV
jgi:hypothetical protein